MAGPSENSPPSSEQLWTYFRNILGPETSFYWLALAYGIGISLLSLATPLSVQMLINTVANVGLATPLVVLSVGMFTLLLIAGGMNALRIHLMDIFGRRFYARIVSEMALRAVYARNAFFEDNRKGALFNRYFDIMVTLKQVPNLLVGGFTILLQTVVGFVLVSSYHPWLFVFNAVLTALIWLVWAIWGKRAIRSAIELSHRKHVNAAWLESIGRSNDFFKSERHIEDVLRRTDSTTRYYMDQHIKHFRHYFSQTLAFIFIYAAASAALLGLGGWLVIQGQLSLGQLVAAELVLSVVFVGISQMGIYLSYFYDVCAAVDELSLFMQIEQEQPTGPHSRLSGPPTLAFHEAQVQGGGQSVLLDCDIPAGARVGVFSAGPAVQRLVVELLKSHARPDTGTLELAGTDLRTLRSFEIRQEIIVIDRPAVVEGSLRNVLRLSADDDQAIDPVTAIRVVGLEPAISHLPEGLDTEVASTGWPLSITETLQLALAAAIIARPRVLVLSQAFDAVPEAALLASLDLLQAQKQTTVLYFSSKLADFGFSHYLYLGSQSQHLYDNYADMCRSQQLAQTALRAPTEGGSLLPGTHDSASADDGGDR
ncbi:MAG: ABC transporter transmembrane domain-containing protein [Chromatocurvus sp.]